MEISKAEAERMLGVSSTTLYNWANKLNIKFINKVDSKGKSSYLNRDDLKRMADAMGKPLESKTESVTNDWQPPTDNHQPNRAEEWVATEIKQENFMLQLKVKEQEEVIKSNYEVINIYKENNLQLQNNQQEAKNQIQEMYGQLLGVSNKATTYFIIAIAVTVILVLFVVLVATGNLKF